MRAKIRTRRLAVAQRGTVAVEMALTLPLLLFIVFASYEFCRANMIRHTVEAAAYEGARQGILPAADEQQIEDGANFVLASVAARGATIEINPSPLSAQSEIVEVTITVPLGSNLTFAPFFLKEGTIRRTCRLARENAF